MSGRRYNSRVNRLIFVYAVDGGLFNSVTHYAHKLIAPQTYPCDLCALTIGALGTRREWTEFLRSLPVEKTFLHRDEFLQRYPNARAVPLPACFWSSDARGDELETLITSAEIARCSDLAALISLVRERASSAPSHG